MKANLLALVLSGVAALLSGASLWRTYRPPHPSVASPVQAETPVEPVYPLEDTMARLYRLTTKLGRALDQENLVLATFYHHEMDAIAEDIVTHGVIRDGKPIGYMASLMLQPPLAYLEASLERSDLVKSRTNYAKLLQACNTCHTGMGVVHPPIALPPPLEPE